MDVFRNETRVKSLDQKTAARRLPLMLSVLSLPLRRIPPLVELGVVRDFWPHRRQPHRRGWGHHLFPLVDRREGDIQGFGYGLPAPESLENV